MDTFDLNRSMIPLGDLIADLHPCKVPSRLSVCKHIQPGIYGRPPSFRTRACLIASNSLHAGGAAWGAPFSANNNRAPWAMSTDLHRPYELSCGEKKSAAP